MSVNIGELISKRRKELNMTQAQFADKLYVSRKVVSRWELNERVPNTLIVKDLCKVLHISIEEFYNGLNFDVEYRNKLLYIKTLKTILLFAFIGFIALTMFIHIAINIDNFINWDQIYIDVQWLSIMMSGGFSCIPFFGCLNACLIYMINHNNKMKSNRLKAYQVIIEILVIVLSLSLLLLYVNLCSIGYQERNYNLAIIFLLMLVIIPSLILLIIVKKIEKKIKKRSSIIRQKYEI